MGIAGPHPGGAPARRRKCRRWTSCSGAAAQKLIAIVPMGCQLSTNATATNAAPPAPARSRKEGEPLEFAAFDDCESAREVFEGIPDDREVVLLGESTHGTEEFYRVRAAVTKLLVTERGFRAVVLEAEWPMMERVNEYTHRRCAERPFPEDESEMPFPSWMWRNQCMADFFSWCAPRARSMSGVRWHEITRDVGGCPRWSFARDGTRRSFAREWQDHSPGRCRELAPASTPDIFGMDCYSLFESKARDEAEIQPLLECGS